MAQQEQARKVTSNSSKSTFDVASLVLVAILLAAGFILNLTLGNALGIVGIKPQFLIAAYCLAILLLDASAAQSVIIGLLTAVVIQLTTSIPGLNFLTESVGALVMFALTRSALKNTKVMPLVAAFVTTLVSGLQFAAGGNIVMGAPMANIVVKLPIVFGTAAFNAIVVQALVKPLSIATKKK